MPALNQSRAAQRADEAPASRRKAAAEAVILPCESREGSRDRNSSMKRNDRAGTRRDFIKSTLGVAAAAAVSPALADDPFAPPPLTYPSLDLRGPGRLAARDLLNRGYWPVPALPPASGRIESREIAENVYVLTGSGCNVVAVTTGGGTLLIDGGREEHSAALLAAVADLPNGGPVHTLFNTSWRP